MAALWIYGARTRHVFFRLLDVDLIFDPVSLIGDSQEADAVHAGSWRTQSRLPRTQQEPRKIADIEKQQRGQGSEKQYSASTEVRFHEPIVPGTTAAMGKQGER